MALLAAPLIQGIERFPFQDKGMHFLEYGVLCLTICYAVLHDLARPRRARSLRCGVDHHGPRPAR